LINYHNSLNLSFNQSNVTNEAYQITNDKEFSGILNKSKCNLKNINNISNLNEIFPQKESNFTLQHHENEKQIKPISRIGSILDTSSICHEDDADSFYRDYEYSFDHSMDFPHPNSPFKKGENGTFNVSKCYEINNDPTHHTINNYYTNSIYESNHLFDFDMNNDNIVGNTNNRSDYHDCQNGENYQSIIEHQINDYANEICISYFDKIDNA